MLDVGVRGAGGDHELRGRRIAVDAHVAGCVRPY